jgi:hypothetical protein
MFCINYSDVVFAVRGQRGSEAAARFGEGEAGRGGENENGKRITSSRSSRAANDTRRGCSAGSEGRKS